MREKTVFLPVLSPVLRTVLSTDLNKYLLTEKKYV